MVSKKKISKFELLKQEAFKLWEEIIMAKYGNICYGCGEKATIVHHFVPRHKSAKLWFDLENGIPLCNKCHFALHRKYDPYLPIEIALKKGGVDYLDSLKKKMYPPVKNLNIKWLKKEFRKLKSEAKELGILAKVKSAH